MKHGANKGNTDHKERPIDVPSGMTHSVFLRKLGNWKGN